MSLTYTVSTTTPVMISSGGPALVVVNESASASVFLNDSPGIDAYELGPAQVLSWDAGKALYVACAPGLPVTLAVTGDAGALFTPVAVVGP